MKNSDFKYAHDILKNSSLFDENYYKKYNPNVKGDTIAYYLNHNLDELKATSKYFNPEWYLKHNKDIENVDPLLHFITLGDSEGRNYRWMKPAEKSIDDSNILKYYNTIYESDMFDMHYYISENNNIGDMDPIMHYITIGANKGYNPNKLFNTNKYIEDIPSEHITTNPLYHFIKYSFDTTGEVFRNEFETQYGLTPQYLEDARIDDIINHIKTKTTIIMPACTNYTHIKTTLKSIQRYTENYELIIFNTTTDNSKLLSVVSEDENIKIINTHDLISKINTQLNNIKNDVVFILPGTILTPRWLNKLTIEAYADPTIATVTPLTNLMIPNIKVIPQDQKIINQKSYQAEHVDYFSNYEVPINHSCCMYVKKEAIDEIGILTGDNLYESLSKFSIKAYLNGLKNIEALGIFIYQAKSYSLQLKKDSTSEKYMEAINANRYKKTIAKTRAEIITNRRSNKILYFTNKNSDGDIQVNNDFYILDKDYDVNIITLNEDEKELFVYDGLSEFKKVASIKTEHESKYELFNLIVKLRYDLLYINITENLNFNIINETTLLKLANILEIPIIYSNETLNLESKLNPRKVVNKFDLKDKKLAVYTIINSTENQTILSSNIMDDKYDYICFTDDPDLKSDTWKIIIYDTQKYEEQIKKIPEQILSNYDYSLYIENTIIPQEDLVKFINQNYDDKILLTTKSPLNEKHENISEPRFILRNHNIPEINETITNLQSKTTLTHFKYLQLPEDKYEKPEIKKIEGIDKYLYATPNILEKLDEPTTIIIPVYNKYHDTIKCIESIIENTKIPYEILLINDASSDERIEPMLRHYETNYQQIRVITNSETHGFIKSINIALKETQNDVLLLDTSSIVTPKWLMKLKSTAYLQENIATVTPFSNDGSFSVPLNNQQNLIDSKSELQKTANIIEKLSGQTITTPIGNGFCIYIKYEILDKVGLFNISFTDCKSAEDDFTIRATEIGYINILDTTTYVYHNENTSVEYENLKQLKAKFPSYNDQISRVLNSHTYAKVRENIKETLKNPEAFADKNILYVIHAGKGGTLYTTTDLMQHISKDYNVFLLTASANDLNLYYFNPKIYNNSLDDDMEFQENLELLKTWTLNDKFTITQKTSEQYQQIYFNVLRELNIDIVHIRHLVFHTFDMPRIAKRLGLRVILSFHDFYYICPSVNLLDNKCKYCKGHCNIIKSEEDEQCYVLIGIGTPNAKQFIPTWRKRVSEMLKYPDEFITTSNSTYDIYTDIYPELRSKPFHVIEHGRDIETPDVIDVTADITKEDPIRILVPGNINKAKGLNYIYNIKQADKNNRIEFHFIGEVSKEHNPHTLGIMHGTYKRSEFNDYVKKIDPHFIAIFSIWPETYCHTLTEAWGSGKPVLTMDIGALGERVHANGGGFILPDDPKEAFNKIISLSEDNENYQKQANKICDITFKSTAQMAYEYTKIYDE